ncbi:MAG: hypothetical protein Tsb0014_01990 [Pleurocapsa sp.]
MSTDSQSTLSILSHLRHELRTPINAIIGYSEMLVEEIEELEHEVVYLQELEQIRGCGLQLLSLINTFLNSSLVEEEGMDIQTIVTNPRLQIELKQPTQAVISYCEQLFVALDKDFIIDLEKIDRAANRLLQEITNIVNLSQLEPVEELEIETTVDSLQNSLVSQSKLILDENSDRDTILVVDDNEINRDLLSRQIEAQGYCAVTAVDGEQAIEMIQTGVYDLILLDILMPKLNGYEVLKWIRNSQWKHIPTIMISALDEIDSVVKCIEMGAEDYLSKPFNPVLLKARVGACLEQKRARDRESLYLSQLAQANEKITVLNSRLQEENLRLSTELEVTQRLQTMILPKEKELSQIDDLEIAGFMEPADEVGGDYYDVLQHNGRLTIGIGDVTGHGLESGVLMLMVQTAVRTLMENNETDPKKFFEVLNRTIYKNVQRMNSDKNLTLCLIDYQNNVLSLSGQHEEIVVVRAGGKIERIDTIDLGFPIGLEETIEDFVFQAQIRLNHNDVVILYTDGITEAENDLGVQYGIDSLCAIVKQNWHKSAIEIRKSVIENLRSHIGVQKIYDDITLVVLKQK